MSTRLGLAGPAGVAEAAAVARDLLVARADGRAPPRRAPLDGAVAGARARRRRRAASPVTCEVTPHHLTLTDEEVARSGFSTRFKMNPPLREAADLAALVAGLEDGTIDAIATDHAPHHDDEKGARLRHGALRRRRPRDRRRRRARPAGSTGTLSLDALRRALLGRTRAGLRPAGRHARPRLSRRRDALRSADALDASTRPGSSRFLATRPSRDGISSARPPRRSSRAGSSGDERREQRPRSKVQGPKSRRAGRCSHRDRRAHDGGQSRPASQDRDSRCLRSRLDRDGRGTLRRSPRKRETASAGDSGIWSAPALRGGSRSSSVIWARRRVGRFWCASSRIRRRRGVIPALLVPRICPGAETTSRWIWTSPRPGSRT